VSRLHETGKLDEQTGQGRPKGPEGCNTQANKEQFPKDTDGTPGRENGKSFEAAGERPWKIRSGFGERKKGAEGARKQPKVKLRTV